LHGCNLIATLDYQVPYPYRFEGSTVLETTEEPERLTGRGRTRRRTQIQSGTSPSSADLTGHHSFHAIDVAARESFGSAFASFASNATPFHTRPVSLSSGNREHHYGVRPEFLSPRRLHDNVVYDGDAYADYVEPSSSGSFVFQWAHSDTIPQIHSSDSRYQASSRRSPVVSPEESQSFTIELEPVDEDDNVAMQTWERAWLGE
jgi:hypothetical protein